MIEVPKGDWLLDKWSSDFVLLLRIRRRLAAAQTQFQHVELLELDEFGKALVIDNLIQSAQADEWIYHESLVHPALCCCPPSGKVAILGGGEGATLREVLRHKWVELVEMVDIDGQVVDFCRQHLHVFHQGAFEDPRAMIQIQDARDWIAKQPAKSYAAVVFDLSEPAEQGPSQFLFTREFYAAIKRVLRKNGVLGMHAGPACTGFRRNRSGEFFSKLYHTVKSEFQQVVPMVAHVFSYSDLWTFMIAGDDVCLDFNAHQIDLLLSKRLAEQAASLRHYDGTCHTHMVNLPRYLRKQFGLKQIPFSENNLPQI